MNNSETVPDHQDQPAHSWETVDSDLSGNSETANAIEDLKEDMTQLGARWNEWRTCWEQSWESSAGEELRQRSRTPPPVRDRDVEQ